MRFSASQADRGPTTILLECTQVLHFFFQCLDERRYYEIAETFLPNARWLRQGRWLKGTEEIVAALQSRPSTQMTCHAISNAHLAECSPYTAIVQAYMTAYRCDGPHGAPDTVPVLSGPFRINQVTTEFHRDPAGWRIAEQRLVPLFAFAPG